jgi:hypothetical protein
MEAHRRQNPIESNADVHSDGQPEAKVYPGGGTWFESSPRSYSAPQFSFFFAVGVATLTFGFKADGSSFIAGVVATALAFGCTLLALAYVLGPISGCHLNPEVNLGALLAG